MVNLQAFMTTYHSLLSASWPATCLDGSSKLRDSFTLVFARNSSILHWALHQPITFAQVSRGSSNRSMKNYGFISDAIFKNCMHAHKSLSNETIISQIRNTVVCMKSLRHLWLMTQGLKRAWAMILQPILHRKPVRTDLLLCDRWQTLAQACICC